MKLLYLSSFLLLTFLVNFVASQSYRCASCDPLVIGDVCCRACFKWGDVRAPVSGGILYTGCNVISTTPYCLNCNVSTGIACTPQSTTPPPTTDVIVYRFVTGVGDHFYTTNPANGAALNYTAEANLGMAKSGIVDGYVILFQYSYSGAGGRSFYTWDVTEGNSLVQNWNYTYVGVLCSAYVQNYGGVNEIRRYVNQGSGLHLITQNPSDAGTSGYWTYEMVLGYMLPA